MAYIEVENRQEIAIIWLDQPNDKTNKLNRQILAEFPPALDAIAADDGCRAVIIISRKSECFIVGADIALFGELKETGAASNLSRQGQELLNRLERFPKPIIAAIRGPALGGGLEVALACHYRVAALDAITVFGLPEVKLGLLPGAGGTQRLVRLVGLQKGLDMMLTGRNIYPAKAKKMGLVDELIHPYGIIQLAIQVARRALSKKPKRRDRRSLTEKLLESTALTRALIYRAARKQVLAQTAGNYPAPLKIIETVRCGREHGMTRGLEAEREAFEALMHTPQSQALIALFFGMTASRKNPRAELARPVKRLGILGAGLMGAGIASVSAEKGMMVILKDIDEGSLGRAEKGLWRDWSKQVDRRILSRSERDRFAAAIQSTIRYETLRAVDLVIEAVFEDLDLKRKTLADIERHTPSHCIFASNTSSLPIGAIAQHAARPDQVIGMHYFSPVPKMPLLEIVVTDQTADWVTATAVEVGIRQGKNIIVVKDGPGFYTTRILAPLLNEAMILLAEGVAIEALDRAMFRFGFPLGPIKLLDEVGIDVGAHVGAVVGDLFRTRGVEPQNYLSQLTAAGFKGRKNGKGFYRYDRGRKRLVNPDVYQFFGGPKRKAVEASEIQQRLTMAMVNEAALCLEEGILASPTDGDLGAVLGLGFPPFLGGPFRYLDSLGRAQTRECLNRLAEKHGPRFKLAGILNSGGDTKFH